MWKGRAGTTVDINWREVFDGLGAGVEEKEDCFGSSPPPAAMEKGRAGSPIGIPSRDLFHDTRAGGEEEEEVCFSSSPPPAMRKGRDGSPIGIPWRDVFGDTSAGGEDEEDCFCSSPPPPPPTPARAPAAPPLRATETAEIEGMTDDQLRKEVARFCRMLPHLEGMLEDGGKSNRRRRALLVAEARRRGIATDAEDALHLHTKEAQTLYARGEPKKKAFQLLHCWHELRHSEKFLSLEANKKTRSCTPFVRDDGEEEDGTPDSSQPPLKKTRLLGRKQSKEKLKHGGEVGQYKKVIQELLVVKEKDQQLKERDRKLKEDKWMETKTIQKEKISIEKEKLMWEKEQKIMFCDISTMDHDQRTYVLAMRAHIAAAKVASLNGGPGGCSSSFGGGCRF